MKHSENGRSRRDADDKPTEGVKLSGTACAVGLYADDTLENPVHSGAEGAILFIQ